MKKLYMKPAVELMAVHAETSILTGSNVVKYGTDNDGEATSTDDNLTRRHKSVWDDEEEEEELY